MTYYTDLRRANVDIDRLIQSMVSAKQDITINKIVLEITKLHAVSDSHVEKRVRLICEDRDIIIRNDTLRLNQ